MKLRRLGASGVSVSPICFGTMLFGNPTTETEATRLMHQAIDRGVTFIDTASSYEGYNRSVGSPGGVAEEYLGRILKGKRDQVVLLTKIANALGPGPHQKGGSRIHLQTELENCLRRLQTDCVDILMLHWPDLETPFEESLRTLDLFVRQGKIRYFGVSNYLAWQMCELLWLSDRFALERMIAYEPPYSMLRRDIEISEIGFCKKFGVGITPYQVLHGGWLSGKYRSGETPPGSRLEENPNWMRPASRRRLAENRSRQGPGGRTGGQPGRVLHRLGLEASRDQLGDPGHPQPGAARKLDPRNAGGNSPGAPGEDR